jgi:hypothetical protein
MTIEPSTVAVTNVVVPLPSFSCTWVSTRLSTPVRLWPATTMLTPVPDTVMPRLIVSVPVSYAALVVLIFRPNVPDTATFGMSTATVAVIVPATPPGSRSRAPLPSVTRTKSRSFEPSRSDRLANRMRVFVVESSMRPARLVPVDRSTETSAVSRCPARVSARPVTETLRYGPAGSDSVETTPSRTNCSSTTTGANPPETARFWLLISTVIVAEMSPMPEPSRSVAVPEIRPATPSGVTRSSALPPETSTPTEWSGSPRNRPTSLACTLRIFVSSVVPRVPSGPGLVTCSKPKTPVRVWPKTVSENGCPTVPAVDDAVVSAAVRA